MSAAGNSICYAKMEGLGNKILVIDARFFGRAFGFADIAFCRSRLDYDFDQTMLLCPEEQPALTSMEQPYKVEIWNKDGSQVEACGNGSRCLIGYLTKYGRSGFSLNAMSLATPSGIIYGRCFMVRERLYDNCAEFEVELSLPAPQFSASAIGLTRELGREERLFFGQAGFYYPEFVSIGNPHAIFFSPYPLAQDGAIERLKSFGPLLEQHDLFRNRCNISLVHVKNHMSLEVRTWERGAGLTQACGSGACAAVIAAHLRGIVGNEVRALLPIGELNISWNGGINDKIFMRGSAQLLEYGQLSLADMA